MLGWVLSTSVLILVILLLRRLLRHKLDPRLTYALWLLVALRICIPTTFFSLPVSVSSLAEDSGLNEAVETVREAVSPKEVVITSISADSEYTLEEIAESWDQYTQFHVYEVRPYTPEELADPGIDNPSFLIESDRTPLRMTVEKIIMGRPFWNWVHWIGALVTFVVLSRLNGEFHRRLKRYRKPYEGELPVPCPVPVYVVSSIPSPCLYQMFRTAIYLNDAAVEHDRLDHILTHEIIHFRHKDHWWATLRFLCLCVQWFNPLVWVAAWASRRDCELACDASAVRYLGEDQRLGYGRTLVDMIAAGRYPGAFLQTATTMVSGREGIAQRIRLIAKRPRMTAVTLVSVLLIAALTAACAFGGAAQGEDPSGPSADAPSVSAPNETPPQSDSPTLEDYFGSTYTMAGHTEETFVQPIAISYSPARDGIGELLITEDFFGCPGGTGMDWGENVTDPVYAKRDFDPSVYGQSHRFHPALDEFFGRYGSIAVYEIENASKPTHLLLLDGELWMACRVTEAGCYLLRLEGSVTPDAPEHATQLPAIDDPSGTITVGSDPLEFAQSVYAAIVGDHDTRDFYMEVTDGRTGGGTTTRLHITTENGWNLPDTVTRFQWDYASSDGSEASLPITISTPDGSTWLRCWADSDRVRLYANGQDYFLTARIPELQQLTTNLHSSLLQTADEALVLGAYNIVVDGTLTDYAAVAEEYARQFAANLNALPDWASSKPEEVVYRGSSVSQAYFGEDMENFCASFGLYFSPEMGNSVWQAGSGMDQETEGEYAGWWMWAIGANFVRDKCGDWYCTGTYTGGEFLDFPTPLNEATVEELVYYFYHTWGDDHDYLIPYYICQQPLSSLEELNRLLHEQDDPAALCAALGRFLRDYGDYDDILLTYDVLLQELDAPFAAWLTEGYTAAE